MKKIRILKISFEQQISPKDLPKFRGAIIKKTGQKGLLFHNHTSNNKFRYSYPLIQYKVIENHGCLVCIDEGTEEIHTLLSKRNMDVMIGEQKLSLTIDSLTANNFKLNVWDKSYPYQIRNWLALNEENYQKYSRLTSLVERVSFLEKILIGNILSFAKGVDYQVEGMIDLHIQKIKKERMIKYKGVALTAFDLIFTANFFLPNHIGLGKGVSIGFGVVHTLEK